jgi:hypothetical protein
MILRSASICAPVSIASRPVCTARLAPDWRSASMMASARTSSSCRVVDGRIAAAVIAVGSTL